MTFVDFLSAKLRLRDEARLNFISKYYDFFLRRYVPQMLLYSDKNPMISLYEKDEVLIAYSDLNQSIGDRNQNMQVLSNFAEKIYKSNKAVFFVIFDRFIRECHVL